MASHGTSARWSPSTTSICRFRKRRSTAFSVRTARGNPRRFGCCAGFYVPTAGDVNVLGHPVPQQSEQVRRLIGYMTQQFSLYRDLSVHENLDFIGRIQGLSSRERRQRTEEVLADLRPGAPRAPAAGEHERRRAPTACAGGSRAASAADSAFGRAHERRRSANPARLLGQPLCADRSRDDNSGVHALHGRGRALPSARDPRSGTSASPRASRSH